MARPDVLHIGDGITDCAHQMIKRSSSCIHDDNLRAIAEANMTQTPAMFADTPVLGLAEMPPRTANCS